MFARALSTFHPSRILLVGAAVAALAAMPATAQVAKQGTMAKADHSAKASVKTSKLTWTKGPDFLPAGAMMAVVSGDPGKPGPFTVELSFPNGYAIAPHTHPTAEHVTVKSGELWYGMGDDVRKADMKAMKPGNSGDIPANMSHYVRASGKTRIVVSSTGPFVTKYVHAKDDPRTKAN
jgi:quercetin dioxygenase-like cupin family protein